ncbi:unnamed protein product [Mytilus coruscus]|uniref:Tyr recombinase domain-containing protein n=1 Tax=Mytilus coruscus TaxID=42192 RepID=A0A6J8EBP6_MYTCO|nr:unnamed protein product [Mytilus coruscus]
MVQIISGWLTENKYSSSFEELDETILNDRLCYFYASLQTKQGTDYSKSALVGIRSAISRHKTGPPYNREINIITDKSFMPSNHVITDMMKKLKREGKDITVHKKAVAEGDIQKLYSSGIFSTDHPVTLQNKVFWDIMLNFGRRGQEGLTDLKKTTYAKYKDDKGQEYYKMTYNECDKTHHGVDSKENSRDQALQYPKPTIWYAAQTIGKNKLASMMSRISEEAGLSIRYTNHCLRATVATGLKRAGVDDRAIMSVTGHRNVKSLDSYIEGPTDKQCRELSNTLQRVATANSDSALNENKTESNATLKYKQRSSRNQDRAIIPPRNDDTSIRPAHYDEIDSMYYNPINSTFSHQDTRNNVQDCTCQPLNANLEDWEAKNISSRNVLCTDQQFKPSEEDNSLRSSSDESYLVPCRNYIDIDIVKITENEHQDISIEEPEINEDKSSISSYNSETNIKSIRRYETLKISDINEHCYKKYNDVDV